MGVPYSRFLEEDYLFPRLNGIFNGQVPKNPRHLGAFAHHVGTYLACGVVVGIGKKEAVLAEIDDKGERELCRDLFDLGVEVGEALKEEKGELSREEFETEIARISWRVGKYLTEKGTGRQ